MNECRRRRRGEVRSSEMRHVMPLQEFYNCVGPMRVFFVELQEGISFFWEAAVRRFASKHAA